MGVICSKDGVPIIIEKPEEQSRIEEEDQTEARLRKKALQKIKFIDNSNQFEQNSPLFNYVEYTNPAIQKLQEFHKQYKFSQMEYFDEQELDYYKKFYLNQLPSQIDKKLKKPIKCKVIEEIGCGSYGKIQKAFDTNNRIPMAIKCMIKSKEHKDIFLQQFQKEIEFLQTLNHPNIVKFYGFLQTKNYFKIYLEYMSEGSIFDLIQKYGPLSENITANYTKQILLGLEYLHSQNIIHRDIKAGNVLVGDQVKLSDFGTAEQLENSYLNSLTGTKCWMAPEVIKRKGHERFADIWSLGCTVFEMMTGKPPFYDQNPVIQKVQNFRQSHQFQCK